MNGVRIGEGSIVGAGSLLLKRTEIPPFSLVVGSPAKVKKMAGLRFLNRFVRQVPIMSAEQNTTATTGRNSHPRHFVLEHRSSWGRRYIGEFLQTAWRSSCVDSGLKEPCDRCLTDGLKEICCSSDR